MTALDWIIVAGLAILGGGFLFFAGTLLVGGTVGTRLGRRFREPTTEVRGRDFILCDHPDDDDPEPMTDADVDALTDNVLDGTPMPERTNCDGARVGEPCGACDACSDARNDYAGEPADLVPAMDLDDLRALVREQHAADRRQAEQDQRRGSPWTDPNLEVEPDPRRTNLAQWSDAWAQHLQAEDPTADPAYVRQLADAAARDEVAFDEREEPKPVSPWDAMPPGFGQAKRVNGSAS